MNDRFIQNVRLVRPGEGIAPASVLMSGAKIAAIAEPSAPAPQGALVTKGEGRLLTPGLIDLHIHGVGLTLLERAPEDVIEASKLLPKFGTTCILPTLYRVMNRSSLNLLDRLATALTKVSGACMPGFHLEGPFMALTGAGCETVPGDVGLLKEVLDACQGRVLAMSISPDTPNIMPVIEYLVEKRIVPFITHTRASTEQTEAALEAGARHATHFYDVFPLPEEKDPGVRPAGAVEAILADPRASVDFICDGVHVSPVAIKAALAAKTYAGVVLITDSNIGAGMPAGEYPTPWGFSVKVSPTNAARIAKPDHPHFGALAGSALTMDQGMRNLLRWLSLPAHQTWAMGTSNPARIVGLKDKGQIRVGADADLVLWGESLHAAKTWVGGKIVYGEDQ